MITRVEARPAQGSIFVGRGVASDIEDARAVASSCGGLRRPGRAADVDGLVIRSTFPYVSGDFNV
jgi:hypothetical protein